MSDARIEVVMSRLQAEASSLVGELMLGSLIETARDAMTAINQPEGNCIYCLEDLVPADWDPNKQVQGLLRLPCYHTFHQYVQSCAQMLVSSSCFGAEAGLFD